MSTTKKGGKILLVRVIKNYNAEKQKNIVKAEISAEPLYKPLARFDDSWEIFRHHDQPTRFKK